MEYQINSTTGNWTEIANNGTIPNLEHNTTIYARLTDGNNHGDHASTTIKDTVNPTVTIQSLTTQDTTIQITAKGTDNETGINEYIFYIKESTQEDSSYQEKTRNTTGTANGISNMTWYKMYEGQKEYKNTELVNSKMITSMIWGSQWDHIMVWMKDVKNGSYYYVTNAIGMGNYYGDDDDDINEEAPAATGKREAYKVKNIYDLAGNVADYTFEVFGYDRIARGWYYGTEDGASRRHGSSNVDGPNETHLERGSRLVLY